ncbi:MAG: hypothetical protein GXW99_05440 [Clostridiales bacterium]|nr:hypothetical protein [Clostridiales bacterium]
MATSGSLNTSAYDGRYLQLAWERTTTNVAANTSTLHWTLTGAGSAGSSWYYAGPFTVVIDGQTVFSGGGRIQLYNGTSVASGDVTILHNADGTRGFSASVSAAIYSSSANVSGSDSWSLDTIPRASVPTLSASSLTMGGTIRINTNTASSSFHHKVRYVFGGSEGGQAEFSDYDSSLGFCHMVNWTELIPPVSLASRVPNATYGTCTVYLKTYSDSSFSTQIGSEQSVSFRLDVPASVVPTSTGRSGSAVNDNPFLAGKDVYVKKYTKLKAGVSAEGAYGSTVKKVAVTCDGKTYTADYVAPDTFITTDALTTVGDISVKIVITDSRGRTNVNYFSRTVQPYAAPTISSLAYQRGAYSGGTWTASDTGADVKISFTLGLSLTDYGNTASLSVAVDGETTQTASGQGVGSKTYYFTSVGVDVTRAMSVTATDSVGTSASKADTISTIEVPLNIDAPLNRIAIGGVAEKSKVFQCKWPAEFTGGVKIGDAAVADFAVECFCPHNIWYQKYKSGVIKCWLHNSTTYTGSTPTALMGGYVSYVEIEMPISCTDVGWTGVASGRLGTGYGFALVVGRSNNTIRVYILGNQNSNSIELTGLCVFGHWK